MLSLKHNPHKLKLVIEALLFSVQGPLSLKEISNILGDIKEHQVLEALDELKEEIQRLERSFVLVKVGNGYQFRTKKEFAPYILKLYQDTPYKLSNAALETLAVIAYKQPITRYEIEALRGVDVSHTLKVLLEKGLIKIAGRKDLPGRPFLYKTTNKFLEVFGLEDLKSLPDLNSFKEEFRLNQQEIPLEEE